MRTGRSDIGFESDVLQAACGVTLLAAAIERLAAEPAGDADRLLELERLADRLEAERARSVRAVHRNGAWARDGAVTMRAWLRHELRCSGRRASRAVRVAECSSLVPDTEQAWAAGRITTEHAQMMALAAGAANAPVEFAEYEPTALEIAEGTAPDVLAKALEKWRHALDDHRQRVGDSLAVRRYEERHVALVDAGDGALYLSGTLSADDALWVQRALDKEYRRQHQAADDRTPGQQRADALVGIARRYLGATGVGVPEPGVMAVIDPDTYERITGHQPHHQHGRLAVPGRCHTPDGNVLSPHTAARAVCAGTVQALLTSLDGAPLALGRKTRLFTAAQRRAITIRDGGCRWPGCDRPPRDCETHHLTPFSEGGTTDTTNGVLLCWHHHHKLHEYRYRATLRSDGACTFHPPDHGPTLTSTPHPPPGVRPPRARGDTG